MEIYCLVKNVSVPKRLKGLLCKSIHPDVSGSLTQRFSCSEIVGEPVHVVWV
jgi:hypothetical protein